MEGENFRELKRQSDSAKLHFELDDMIGPDEIKQMIAWQDALERQYSALRKRHMELIRAVRDSSRQDIVDWIESGPEPTGEARGPFMLLKQTLEETISWMDKCENEAQDNHPYLSRY